MSIDVYLDRSGTASKSGVAIVTSEADFLRLALEGKPILVQGESLCRWSQRFCAGRGLVVQTLVSPIDKLLRLLPRLPADQALSTLAQWPALADVGEVEQIVQVVLDTTTSAGEAVHAAHWLMWWATPGQSAAACVLMEQTGSQLALELSGQWRETFDHATPSKAQHALRVWLRREGEASEWPIPFPLPLTPPLADQLRNEFQEKAAAQGAAFYHQLQERGADPQVLALAGAAVGEWLRHHPEHLSRALLRELQDYLPATLHTTLLGQLPPPMPPSPPADAAEWAKWMADDYLPYRSWHRADHAALQPHLRGFVETFLPTYSAALNGGAHAERLVWQRSAALKGQPYVTLVAVCDGLNLHDLAVLQGELRNQDTGRRLTLTQEEVAFGALPTITSRAKPALFRGVAPAQAEHQPLLGFNSTKEEKVMEALQQAQPGEVVFWNIAEPDATYHKAESLEHGQDKARAELGFIAKRLLYLLAKPPAATPVQLVVTTDHGRLLRVSERKVSPPSGFVAEGRAAYGQWDDVPSQGFELLDVLDGEGGYALLGRNRFGLAEDAAALFSDQTFLDAAGRSGTVVCPHGGLSPEEVLLPWCVYVRDLAFRLPTLTAQGEGRAEQPGEVVLSFTNANGIPLMLESLSGPLTGRFTDWTPWQIPAQSTATRRLPVASWPTKAELPSLTLRAKVRASQGTAQDIAVAVSLETEELYTATNDILGDLL
jgi:hypothetical protein